MPINFTLQDIAQTLIAFLLFPLVILIPGYVTGWALDLFDFRRRQFIARLGIGLILSFAISPIVLDLTSSLVSLKFSLLILGFFFAAFLIIFFSKKPALDLQNRYPKKILYWIIGLWTLFVILSLVDLQWGDQLYYSVVSFDQTTRVSIIEAMTRTSVPPINPSYYPGHPVRLTYLYYFWYILCSLVDLLGGSWVDARAALNAGIVWCGLGLMAVVAIYLRLRDSRSAGAAWRSAWIGIASLSISGLDAIPVGILMLGAHSLLIDIEHWNTQITAWVGSILWVPHHVAALIAGLSAVMLVQVAQGKSMSRQFVLMTIAGLAFASAFGLSVWVTLVLVVFWGVWIVVLFFENKERRLILPMIYAGITALIFASPFLAGLLQGDGSGSSQFPIAFEVRNFFFMNLIASSWPPLQRSLVMLAILPVNYLFELGFFMVVGIAWFKVKDKEARRSNPFYRAEIILLLVVLFIGSFLRSTIITNNDLGWRAWLPGQFILLIWGVDVIEAFFFNPKRAMSPIDSPTFASTGRIRTVLATFALIGLLTSLMDVTILRFAVPLQPGENDGQRIYSARLAYGYLRDHLPPDVITQNNPKIVADRPSGLYGTHQMVISDRTSYGVPAEDFSRLVNEIGTLFADKAISAWNIVDQTCSQHGIDVLIVADTDPLWNSMERLKSQRLPLYINDHYAIYACGKYARP